MDFDFSLVSRTIASAGQGGNDGVLKSWSPDGRFFLFGSYSSAIPSSDGKSGNLDYYVFDTQTGGISLVTRTAASAVAAANGDVIGEPMFLGNGRIIFYDDATNMAATDTNGHYDLFLFNPYDGTTALVSHTASSQTTSATSGVGYYPQNISADGKYILLEVSDDANDMATSDTNQSKDLYLYDVSTGSYDLVTHASGSTTTAVNSTNMTGYVGTLGYVFAPDGNHAAYDLQSTQPGGYVSTAYVYDRVTHGQVSLSGSYKSTTSVEFSHDGRYLIYNATATGASAADIRLYDTQTSTSVLVSHTYGNPSTSVNDVVNVGYNNLDVHFSPDDKSLLIESSNGSMAPNDTNNQPDLYLYDVVTGNIDLITHQYGSTAAAGAVNNSLSIEGYSADSRYLLYSTNTATLANSDTNGAWDFFLYDRQTHNNIIVGQASSGTAATGNGDTTSTHVNWLSPDSKYLLFYTNSSNIAATDTANTYDTFLLNIATGTTMLVSHALGADSGAAIGSPLTVADNLQTSQLSPYSSDGRYILLSTNDASKFTSDTSDHSNGGYGDDLFLYDIQDGSLDLITHAYDSPTVTSNGATEDGVFTADGKFVVFTSSASNLVGSATFTGRDNVYIYEIATGTTTLVTDTAAGLMADNHSYDVIVSPDGKHLVFHSYASNLGDSNRTSGSGQDIYVTGLSSGSGTGGNVAPVFTSNGGAASATISIAENKTAVATLHATDTDGDSLSYSITGGADAARFTINSTTGALAFVTAADFEKPNDSDADNSYGVTIGVSDGNGGTAQQQLTINVTNVAGVSVQATSGNNKIDASHPFGGKAPGAEADSIKGLAGNDSIWGLGGNDTLVGGTGKDVLYGGADSDKFVFAKGDSGITTSKVDTIADWSNADSVDTSIAGKSSNYYEHSVSSSVDTIEEAAAYAKAHATSSSIAHVFLYNSSKDIGFVLMDLDHNHTFETGLILSHSGKASDFSYADVI